MGFDLEVTISAMSVFIQGILSFFSPCVLPILPLYMSYLAGGGEVKDEQGELIFPQKKVFFHTLFFILGVSFAFFILGFGFSSLGVFLTKNQIAFSRIGGIMIILFGLFQLGVFNGIILGKEKKLPIKINLMKMNPITAMIMGFTFSFAWTPCVGPALSTVLIMISSTNSQMMGILLMGVYTIGFTLPFLVMGLFTTKCLMLLKKYRNIVVYTVKIGAIVMILMGIMMFTGIMNNLTSYLAIVSDIENQNTNYTESEQENTQQENKSEIENQQVEESGDSEETQEEMMVLPAIDFSLYDQYGKLHTLEDYEGKVIFLNFWATWCPPCVAEMPDIQRIYEEYGENRDEVIILGVAMPNDENSWTSEGSQEQVIAFLAKNKYTYPTIMDLTGELAMSYGISAFPTTFMIDVNGNVYGYIAGALTYDVMVSIIEQTRGE